ncbi:MAG: NYN domain-containing protein [Candidatus Omnitrophica bacterium]|nr:NYN domain-containing protein [Candidatus Omnitrophota bacterium]MCM8798841.1 NYN domain-containing protein [Candidatus Omnitrophota bacterium]
MSLHFIVDGYNLMKQVPHILGRREFRDREDFILFLELERPYGSRRNKVTVVFDGKEDVYLPKINSEIEIIFSRGETADERIKRMVEKLNKKNLVVISNDNEIKYFAKIQGVSVMGAEEFLGRIIKRKRYASLPEKEKINPETKEGLEITKELGRIWLKKEKS